MMGGGKKANALYPDKQSDLHNEESCKTNDQFPK